MPSVPFKIIAVDAVVPTFCSIFKEIVSIDNLATFLQLLSTQDRLGLSQLIVEGCLVADIV